MPKEKLEQEKRGAGQGFRKILQFYLIDCETLPGKLIDIFILLLNLVVCAIFVVETYPISEETRQFLWKTEVFIVFFFIIEYAARIYGSRSRLKGILNVYNVIDLVAILPTLSLLVFPLLGITLDLRFIKGLRIFRVLRVFRFLRFTADPDFFFGSIPIPILRVIRLVLTILIIFFVSSGAFYYAENSVNPNVGNFGDAFYFSVVALTTVGFGDITPQSQAGKWVTVLMIISGIIFIPWQVSRVVKEWIHIGSKKEVVCRSCGLRYHDVDASHCKSCGAVIYQEYDGE
jgi:voltage-gated potassium channel